MRRARALALAKRPGRMAFAFLALLHGVEGFSAPHVTQTLLTHAGSLAYSPDGRAANEWRRMYQFGPFPLPSRRLHSSAISSAVDDNNFFLDLGEDKDSAEARHFLENQLFVLAPFFAAFASFLMYPLASRGFHSIAVLLSNNKWVPVDGGQLQWSVLLPALNGVVMTCVSLLYANLISTTGTQLRNRQIKIQESLTNEINGIRGLAQLLPYYPEGSTRAKSQCGSQLMVYLKLLTLELSPDSDPLNLRSASPPLFSYREKLHCASVLPDGEALNDVIRERSYEMLDRVVSGRSARISALQNTFPPLHYVTITALTAAILFVFLIETDRPVILFLDNFQLRLIWGLLVGTLTAIYCIGIDLSSPFVGTYVVPADQLLEEGEDLLTLIRESFTPPANGSGGSRGGDINGETYPLQTNVSAEAPSMPLATDGINGGNDSPPLYSPPPPNSSTSNVEADSENTSLEQATSFEEYMRRREQGEY